MQVAEPGTRYSPREDKALIIFMRPSMLGLAAQSSVFELVGEDNEFIAIVPAKHKVAQYVDPGEHMFMVVGERADFLRALVDPGKTYYVLVAPRPGSWKARFSLRPVRGADIGSEEVQAWLNGCTYLVSTDEARRWSVEHSKSVAAKRALHLPKWHSKSQESRDEATLRASDGR
jgi:hypothetical protein